MLATAVAGFVPVQVASQLEGPSPEDARRATMRRAPVSRMEPQAGRMRWNSRMACGSESTAMLTRRRCGACWQRWDCQEFRVRAGMMGWKEFRERPPIDIVDGLGCRA